MKILEFCKNKKQILIYGAGVYGQRLHKILTAFDLKIDSFIVSDNQNHPEQLFGVPIKALSDVKNNMDGKGILLAVSDRFLLEMKNILEGIGGVDYFVVDNRQLCDLMRAAYPVDASRFLNTIEPISRVFGFDRGTPIDRVYMKHFLSKEIETHALKNGNILEVGDRRYSTMYFGMEHSKLDVLDYFAGQDLTKEETLPCNEYDVFICTQVFNFIYDVKKAIQGAYQLLKTGGYLLATVNGNIGQLSMGDYRKWGDYWNFTDMSIRKLMSETFGEENVSIRPYGNVAVATGFIQGLSAEDMEELGVNLFEPIDKEYAVTIGVCARKAN